MSEPRTQAGKALVKSGNDWHAASCMVRFDGNAECSCPLTRLILAIEQEAAAAAFDRVARAVEGLPWNVAGQNTAPVGGCDEEWAVSEYRAAVLAAIKEARS